MILWLQISEAPKDGSPFWGFLHDMGIRKLKWSSPEEAAARDGGEPEDYEGAFVDPRHHQRLEPEVVRPFRCYTGAATRQNLKPRPPKTS